MPDPISWSQDLPYFAAGFLFAYLLGSIPFGLVLTKFSGAGDIREIGSGNIGATNVLRTGRKGLAIATLLLDAAKGCVAVLIGQSFGPDLAIIAAWGAVLGHLFPVWLKFKGGKGGATALGVGIGLVPLLAFYAGLTWLAVAILLRYSHWRPCSPSPPRPSTPGCWVITRSPRPLSQSLSDLAQASCQYPPPPRR